jgi:Tfp pilus assembly protein PilX
MRIGDPIDVNRRRAEPARPTRTGGERGVALILTLAILALVTLLLIAFVTSMRVENAASKNFNELIKARELAQAGVDEAVGAIRLAAPPVSLLTNYVTAPGMIYTWSPNVPTSTHWTNVALFTSDPANPNGVIPTTANLLITNEVDLNKSFVITGSGTVYNAISTPPNSGIWVGWSNVVATVNGGPQLVGRYAYWVDDESAKVNLNVASSRGNDLEGWTPAGIDLLGLGPPLVGFQSAFEVGTLTNYVQNTRPLDTIQSMVMLSPPLPPSAYPAPGVSTNTFSNTQFYVTTHSTSPDITPWGDKRLNLSNFIYVVSGGSKVTAVNNLANWLAAEDGTLSTWFGGKSFTAKYLNLQQIAANIVDYITTDNTPTDSGNFNSTTAPSFLGLKETPYLNELVISNTFQVLQVAGSSPAQYYVLVQSYQPVVELWYMYTNTLDGTGWTATGNPEVRILNNTAPLTIKVTGVNPGSVTPLPAETDIKTIPSTMGPNTYAVVPISPALVNTATLNLPPGSLPASVPVTLSGGTITAIFTTQKAQNPGQQGRMDFAFIGFSASKPVKIPTTGVQVPVLWASQCNDPRVKPVSDTWNWTQLPTPTLGKQNSPLAFNQSAGRNSIPGDGDPSCHIVSANIPNTTGAGRQRGAMTPGELAFIHTGVPWRTFSLQPWPSALNPAEPGPPDWALLDWFSAASTLATDVVGRININQTIHAVSPPGRAGPMGALLTNSVQQPVSTTYNVVTATNNIYNYDLNTTLYRTYTASQLGPNFCPSAYTMAGEIANTATLTAPPSGGILNKAVTETPIRDIANLVTPRSNTFTIWCLAQSIKKVDKSNPTTFLPAIDVVTGEAKVQAIVERTVVNDASGNPTQVKFRTLYYRYYYQ